MWALARSLVRSGLRQPDACVLAAAFSQQAASFSSVERVQCCVIGAGLVGLACARALAVSGKEVLLVDAASAVGTETSARHSEVIHAGSVSTQRSHPVHNQRLRLCVAAAAPQAASCSTCWALHHKVTSTLSSSPAHGLQASTTHREASRPSYAWRASTCCTSTASTRGSPTSRSAS